MSDSIPSGAHITASFDVLLGIAFVVLKLCHVIDWSWWWVLAPFWVPLALVLVLGVVVVPIMALKGNRP